VEVRLWHEFARYVSLIGAKTTEGRSLFAPAFLSRDPVATLYMKGRSRYSPHPQTKRLPMRYFS
jgi:hypothetical protein